MAVDSSYEDAPARTVSAGGVDFAYRELGPKAGVPVIFLVHSAGNLDNWDPRAVGGIAARRLVITLDSAKESFSSSALGCTSPHTPSSTYW